MSGTTEAPPRGATAVAIAIAAVLVLGVFGRIVTHPFIAFDDTELILRNREVTDPFSSWADQLLTPRVGYVVPVTVGVEAVLHAISGGRAWSFHAAALCLHLVFVAALVGGARRFGARPLVAFGAVSLFALHPLVVQPVAWASSLKDLLMANFAWAATMCWLDAAEDERASSPRALGAVALALAAMLSKPSAVLIGFAWLAVLVARRAAGRSSARPAWHAAAATAALGVLAGLASRVAHDAVMGAERAPDASTALPFAVLGRQVLHVVWPDRLAILYAAPSSGWADRDAWIGVGVLALVAGAAWWARARPRVVLPVAVAAAIYLPTSNVLPFARVMSDSYMYVPLAMLALVVALVAERALARAPAGAARIARVALVLPLGLLAGRSYAEVERWQGGDALWQPVVEAAPGLAQAHRLHGEELVYRGEPARAIEPYRRAFALEYDPRYLSELGSMLAMAGRLEDAECVLVEAFAFGTSRAEATYNYAVLLAFHPEYRLREPAVAPVILAELDALLAAGRLEWPPSLLPGLTTQRARLAAAPPAAAPRAWQRRTCAILRPG